MLSALLSGSSLFVAVAAQAQAPTQPLLNELFQDHAVLQRGKPISVWGQAADAEVVTVTLAASSVRTQADASGHWRAMLPATGAGGPFVLTAQGSSGARQSGLPAGPFQLPIHADHAAHAAPGS